MKKSVFNSKKEINMNRKNGLCIFLLGIMIFVLVACGKEEQGVVSWNNVAGESLATNVTDEEIQETVEMINAENDLSEARMEVLDENEVIETEEKNIEESILLENLTFEASISENTDTSIHAIFRIIDGNGNTIQVIENDPFFTEDWFEAFSDSSCYFEDYNFDGYLDVVTIGSSGYVNSFNFVYLWNPDEEQFEFSSECSDIANAVIYADKKQIISVSRDAGLPIYRLYELKDGKITYVAEIMEVHAEDGSVVCTETIFETEEETVVTKREQLNEIWDGYNIELYN